MFYFFHWTRVPHFVTGNAYKNRGGLERERQREPSEKCEADTSGGPRSSKKTIPCWQPVYGALCESEYGRQFSGEKKSFYVIPRRRGKLSYVVVLLNGTFWFLVCLVRLQSSHHVCSCRVAKTSVLVDSPLSLRALSPSPSTSSKNSRIAARAPTNNTQPFVSFSLSLVFVVLTRHALCRNDGGALCGDDPRHAFPLLAASRAIVRALGGPGRWPRLGW